MRAKRSLGQNFLREPPIIDRIVDALGPIKPDTVIEIGPGRGALTERLIDGAGEVIAIEFDRDMIAILHERFSNCTNFTLVNADALNFDYATIVNEEKPVKLVANLPYNISTPILQSLGEQRTLFSSLVLMFQREVVERITAAPRGKERGFLSVIVQDAFETEHLFDVAPTAFVPIPKVWSSVVRLVPKPSTGIDPKIFRKVVSASFAQRRKTLLNNLKSIWAEAPYILIEAGIEGTRRAETLDLNEWRALTQVIEKASQTNGQNARSSTPIQ
jgi:16S rRNA (adenine1518-N6/adenine1519-N6)-dimethyltransferase